MKCPKCGAELTEDTKFCSFCGEKIKHHSNEVHEQNISNNSIGKGSKTSKDVKISKSNTQSEKKSIADNLKEKGIEYWNCLSIFGKVVAVSITVFAILALAGFLSGKTIAGIISLVQITLVVVAILMNKEVIKSPNNWAKYVVLAAAILFTILNIKSYSWGNVIKTNPSTSLNNTTVQTAPGVPSKS
ncbi:MAG: zinc ribbon domain-containing protein [Bacilli bacterium]